MKRKLIIELLNHYFPHPKPPLKHKSVFELLIAVILSARSTDKKVNEITPLLFKKANNCNQMAKMKVDALQKIIKPCGLSLQKAKNIIKLCHLLQEQYKGQVPKIYEALVALPGVGPKTAQVVLAQGFSKDAFPVDTHVMRLAKRWKLTKANSVLKIEKDLKSFFLQKDWSRVHLQMVYYGREYCKSRPHIISKCPICHSLAKTKLRKNSI
jgi:endonuclease-3